jgi:ABC-type multidrug transport system ATPase subunit
MLIVTHDLADAWPLADRFALLSDGELRALESKEELLESGADLAKLGMALPQWGELAKMLSDSGHPADDVSDPSKLADAAAEMLEANRGGR